MSVPLYLDETTPVPTELSREITLGKKISSSGAHSKIYEASINGNPRYLAKVIPLDGIDRKDCPNDDLIVRNELLISQDMSVRGIGPTVRGIALNRYKGILVLDRYDGNLSELLLSYQDRKEIHLEPLIESVRKLITSMHEAGVVHRDLTPNNILYNSDGSIVLADYGLAIRSDLESVRDDDWKAYTALVTLVNRIKAGERFVNTRAIIRAFNVEGIEPLTFIWKGHTCSDWI